MTHRTQVVREGRRRSLVLDGEGRRVYGTLVRLRRRRLGRVFRTRHEASPVVGARRRFRLEAPARLYLARAARVTR